MRDLAGAIEEDRGRPRLPATVGGGDLGVRVEDAREADRKLLEKLLGAAAPVL
jgi:hypothetical protein